MTNPRRWAGWTLLLVTTLLSARAAAAQGVDAAGASPDIQPASFWWDVALGSGSLQVSCDICADGLDSGPFVELAVGAYATSRLAVGVEASGWTHLDDDVREELLQAALTVRFAPDPYEGVHFLAGAGWTFYTADQISYNSPRIVLGAGWAFPISPGLAVGNRLTWDVAPFGSLDNDGVTVVDGVRMGLLRFSVFLRSN